MDTNKAKAILEGTGIFENKIDLLVEVMNYDNNWVNPLKTSEAPGG